jgi:4-aminobutyrate aminotransferase
MSEVNQPPQSEGDVNLSSRRREWQDANIDAKTRGLLERDSAVFLHQSLSTPCLNALQSCAGIFIEDTQGRQYMDFHGNSVHQVGFNHPRVIAAISKQLEKLSFSPRRYTNEPAVQLAEKLTAIAPGDLNRVLFAPGGTAAIGMALKLARLATGRHKTISMWDSFHGASLDAISVGGEALFRSNIGPLLPGTEHVPPADPYRCAWGCEGKCNLRCADYIDYIMEREGDVAAVVAETVRSTSVIPPRDYWQKVRQICDKHGALLILDEIPHGLGRTGNWFTCMHYDVVPDMLVIGKGLGGGIFPLAALLTSADLDVGSQIALGHYTHEKNPVAAAAALAAIEVLEDENLIDKARQLGNSALATMRTMQANCTAIGEVRGLGLLLGIELVLNRESKEKANDLAEAVLYCALNKGLSFKTTMGNILTLTPPLTISEVELQRALAIIASCLAELTDESKADG